MKTTQWNRTREGIPEMLTAEQLNWEIRDAVALAKPGHDHLQVCLWFAKDDELRYENTATYIGPDLNDDDEEPAIVTVKDVWPVSHVTITTHGPGEGVARGGSCFTNSYPLQGLDSFRAATDTLNYAAGYAAYNLIDPTDTIREHEKGDES